MRSIWLLLTVLMLPAHAQQAEPIRIAVAGPMSGQFEALGLQMRLGGETAVADLNAAGGVLGRTVILDIADDVCDRQRADAVANRLVGRGVVFVAGHLCSQPSIEAARVYAGNDIVQISPAATHPDFTDLDIGPGVFRLAERDDMQGQVLGRMLANRFADANIAIVHDGADYGQPLAESTRRAMNIAGKIEVMVEAFDPQGGDYTELVARLRAFGVDVVFVGAKHRTVALIAEEMSRQDLDATIVAGDALATEQYAAFAGRAADGTLIAFPPNPVDNPSSARLVGRLTRGDDPPEGYVIPTYAAIQAWAQAVEAADTLEFDRVVTALLTGRFETALGDIAFNARGDAEIPGFVVYAWRDGAYRVVR